MDCVDGIGLMYSVCCWVWCVDVVSCWVWFGIWEEMCMGGGVEYNILCGYCVLWRIKSTACRWVWCLSSAWIRLFNLWAMGVVGLSFGVCVCVCVWSLFMRWLFG